VVKSLNVIPAKAGIQFDRSTSWIPAFAGMTENCQHNRSIYVQRSSYYIDLKVSLGELLNYDHVAQLIFLVSWKSG
jgi:hypothetical protein